MPVIGKLREDRSSDKRDVDLPLGKARHLDRKDIDPVIEVGAEGTVIDACLDILMGSADKPKINLNFVIPSTPPPGAAES